MLCRRCDGNQQNLVVVQNRVQVFNPDGINWAIEHNPGVLVAIFGGPAPEHRKYAISPVACNKLPRCCVSSRFSCLDRLHEISWAPVLESIRPNICEAVMAFGFILQSACFVPAKDNAVAVQSMMLDFPAIS